MITTQWDGTPLTTAFADAVAAGVRTVRFKVFVNWNRTATWVPNPETGGGTGVAAIDDVTKYCTSLKKSASITGDVPDGVRLVVGYGVSQITITLGGDPTDNDTTANLLWSPFESTSPYYGKKRAGAPVQVFLGFRYDDGTEEYLRHFTGFVQSLEPETDGEIATLVAYDPSDRMRNRVLFPMVLSGDAFGIDDQRWGLNSQWPIGFALEQNGFYASPPPRATTQFRATCHGSMYPEIGNGNYCYAQDGNFMLSRPVFAQGRWALMNLADPNAPIATTCQGALANIVHYGPTSPNKGIQIEWLHTYQRVGVVSSTDTQFQVQTNPGLSGFGSAGDLILFVRGDGTMQLLVEGSTTTTRITSTTAKLTAGMVGQSVFVGVHARLVSSTSMTVTFNVNGTIEAQTVTLNEAYPNHTLAYFCYSNTRAGVENIQFCADPMPTWDNQTWDSPTAAMTPGLNELNVLLPPNNADVDAYPTISDIADAEFAAVWFDDAGEFHFVNMQSLVKDHFDLALTALSDVKSLKSSESTASVINHATAPVHAYVVQPWSWVWAYSHPDDGIHSNATRDWWINLSDPVYGVPTTFEFIPNGGINVSAWNSGSTSQINGYRACRTSDGSGKAVGNLQFTVEVFVDSIHLTVTNPNAFPVYFVSPSQDPSGANLPAGSVGQPMLMLAGRLVQDSAPVAAADEGGTGATAIGTTTSSTGAIADSYDADSADPINGYGEQLYQVPDSNWRQDLPSNQLITDTIVSQLSQPIPTLTPVDIVGDSRLELADRTLVDTAPINGLSQDVYAVGIDTELTVEENAGDAGLAQTLTAKMIAMPGEWVLGDDDYTAPDGTHHVGLSNLGVTTNLV